VPVNNFLGSNSSSISQTPSLTTVYTVQATSPTGCALTITHTVLVDNSVPSLTVSNTSSLSGGVCPNQSITLSAFGAQSYTWTGGVISGTPFVPSSNTQTYVVSGSNACGTNTAATSVSLHPIPTINILPISTTLCAGASATLLATGSATDYAWSGGSATISNGVAFTPTSSNVYTVVGSSANGCVNSSTIQISIVSSPTISITASSPTICGQQVIGLTAFGASNPSSYSWTASNVSNTISFSGQFSAEFVSLNTTYIVVGSDSLGCTSSASLSILVYPKPTLTVTTSQVLVCSSGVVTLTAIGANSYAWSPNANSAATSSTVVQPTASASSPVIYTVQGTNSITGCQNTNTLSVNVFIPTLAISGNTIACPGKTITLSASNGISYLWYTSSGNPLPFATISPVLSSASIFTLTANSSSAGIVCPATKTIAVGVYSNPTISATPEKTIICVGESVKIMANGGNTYNWSNSMSGSTITVTPSTGTANFTVAGTGANGCVSTATTHVEVSKCTGINKLTGSNHVALVYPNPNIGDFIIETTSDITLSLYNNLGQLIKIVHFSELNNYKESFTNLTKGVYFIKGQKDNVSVNQKIIISN
jgi:hypothetical protein